MRREKITDLDKFAKKHILLPYSDRMEGFLHFTDDGYDKKENLKKINKITLNDVLKLLKEDTEWSRYVLDRLSKIDLFRFPEYIKHPLLDFLEIYIKVR